MSSVCLWSHNGTIIQTTARLPKHLVPRLKSAFRLPTSEAGGASRASSGFPFRSKILRETLIHTDSAEAFYQPVRFFWQDSGMSRARTIRSRKAARRDRANAVGEDARWVAMAGPVTVTQIPGWEPRGTARPIRPAIVKKPWIPPSDLEREAVWTQALVRQCPLCHARPDFLCVNTTMMRLGQGPRAIIMPHKQRLQ